MMELRMKRRGDNAKHRAARAAIQTRRIRHLRRAVVRGIREKVRASSASKSRPHSGHTGRAKPRGAEHGEKDHVGDDLDGSDLQAVGLHPRR